MSNRQEVISKIGLINFFLNVGASVKCETDTILLSLGRETF